MKQKIKKTAVAAIAASFLLGGMAPVHAVTPDNLGWVSGYWSTGRVMKGWLDWRSALGWGTIGLANSAITALSGASGGQFTKAAMQAVCGTSAAGVLATWTPKSEPQTASHVKSVVKAAGVVGASSTCGWLTQFAFHQIDGHIPIAQNYVNRNMTGGSFKALQTTMGAIEYEMDEYQKLMRELADATRQMDYAADSYNRARCWPNKDAPCNIWRNDYDKQRARRDRLIASMNRQGNDFYNNMKNVNNLIKT